MAIMQLRHSHRPIPNSSSRFTLITLDLDETVWPSAQVLQEAEEIQFHWLRQRAARLTAVHNLESLREHRYRIRLQYPETAHDLTAVRRLSLCQLLKEFSYSEDLAEEAIAVFLAARNRVTPYPDVIPVLGRLGQTYRLASLTNGNADVRCTPLRSHFHFSFTPSTVGAAKPTPAMFQRALEEAGVEPHEAVHVGDHPELDVTAAQKVGMRAVWIRRSNTPWPAELPAPEVTIKDFYEFECWLAQEKV